MPKKISVKQRAALFIRQLLNERTDWLSGRGPDKCFENGDGKEVVLECLRLLAEKGIKNHAELTQTQQWYVPRNWFTEAYTGPRNNELF